MHHAVLWWEIPPKNGMISHLLDYFFQTSSQEVLQIEPTKDKVQWVLLNNKQNVKIMRVGDTILAATAEAGIDENWCLIDNWSTWNAFINDKYLSSTRDYHNGQYLRVNCNALVTYTNKIGDLPRYSNPVWYNQKGIASTLSLRFLHKHHIMTYNSQYRNDFFVHSPKWTTFKMTKASIFYHNMRHLLKNKNIAHIMANNSCPPNTTSGVK